MVQKFWLFQWLEDHHIDSLEQAADFLPKFGVLEDLKRRAEEAATVKADNASYSEFSIVAGTGVDLSGGGPVCISPVCMRAQVEKLLRGVWHYFDTIVARDVFTPTLLQDSIPRQNLLETLILHLTPILYLREIGAEALVDFVPKPICRVHWEEQATAAGMQEILNRRNEFLSELRKGSSFSFVRRDGRKRYQITNPMMSSSYSIPAGPHKDRKKAQARMVENVFKEYLARVSADVITAHELNLPLGATKGLQGRLLESIRPIAAGEVLFHLELPVLNGVPTRALLELRSQEADSFKQFRSSLRVAATERIKQGESHNTQLIAKEIELDLIGPALDRIRHRLAASETALLKKSGVSLFLGTLATTCGFLAGLPPNVSLPVGLAVTAGATGNATQKYIEEKQKIALDDMFFLWQATEHAH